MRIALAAMLSVGGCSQAAAPRPSTGGPTPPVGGIAVQTWLTTADQRKGLSHEADLYLLPDSSLALPTIDVDESRVYQQMLGVGAAFTDGTAYLVEEKMSASQREALLQDLFGRTTGGSA